MHDQDHDMLLEKSQDPSMLQLAIQKALEMYNAIASGPLLPFLDC
jgi:hypothetical protein